MKKAKDPSEQLQDLRRLPANKRCFDCQQAASTYAVIDFGVFVCSICAGLHREFSHRVKGLSTCNFKEAEVDKLKTCGNEASAKLWMAKANTGTNPVPNVKDSNRLKEFLRLKYIKKAFYQETKPQEKPKPKPPQKNQFVDLLDAGSEWNAFGEFQSEPKKAPQNTKPSIPPPDDFQPFQESAPQNPVQQASKQSFDPFGIQEPQNPVQQPPEQTFDPFIGNQGPHNPVQQPPKQNLMPFAIQEPQNPVQQPPKQAFDPFVSSQEPQNPVQQPPKQNFEQFVSPQPTQPPNSDPFAELEAEQHKKQAQAQMYMQIDQMLKQQFAMQAKMYQENYGVQYPYTFERWHSLVFPKPSSPGVSIPSSNPFGTAFGLK